MEISIFLNPTISIGASIGLFFLLKHFIPKYFEKKAENLATKEDIGEITTIVESIKQQNNKELELIKSELSLKTKAQQAIYDDEREAIIEYLKSCIMLLTTHFDLPKLDNNKEVLNYYFEKDKIFYSDIATFQLNAAKLILFCYNEKLLNESQKLGILMSDMIQKINKFKGINYNIYNKLLESIDDEATTQFKLELSKLENEYIKTLNQFSADFGIIFQQFRDTCKQYLKEKHNIK